jgi:hypothetical protein
MTQLNPYISTDCVVLGFDSEKLKVLLVKRDNEAALDATTYKLPGNLIQSDEDIDNSASRVLKELTGLGNIFLKPFKVFGRPDRINAHYEDMQWLQRTSGLAVDRVVSVAYYSLIKLNSTSSNQVVMEGASWFDINQMPSLAFDHAEIIADALVQIQRELRFEPLVFELLPKKFTLRQLQTLYEVILNKTFDNRNFRKKISRWPFLIDLDEKQEKVPHKPASFYKFDRKIYEKVRNELDAFSI